MSDGIATLCTPKLSPYRPYVLQVARAVIEGQVVAQLALISSEHQEERQVHALERQCSDCNPL